MMIKKISQEALKSLKKNIEFLEFCNDINNLEVLSKRLYPEQVKRLSIEYPGFLTIEKNEVLNLNQKIENDKKMPSFLCLTLIKNDITIDNYLKFKKIKFYINESNGKVIKILQN